MACPNGATGIGHANSWEAAVGDSACAACTYHYCITAAAAAAAAAAGGGGGCSPQWHRFSAALPGDHH